ncbi:hypothetical protein NMU03_17085 [Allocoprobacillus halotolerans]|uniref:HEPN domain-containing protein n=1 Tax=Allocoprobacillus halotolerans TaxID=2944914 RepID=A0ABY5I1N8_9FIRM|nr:hypothetical protein [Allocoprobacillus halotolerans]UTY39234.1 hypothetical protein NMU03_17085 [Allocoprobacillus halotolerans]
MIQETIQDIQDFEEKLKNDKAFLLENPFAFYSFIEMLYHFMYQKYPHQKDSFVYKKAHIQANVIKLSLKNLNIDISKILRLFFYFSIDKLKGLWG